MNIQYLQEKSRVPTKQRTVRYESHTRVTLFKDIPKMKSEKT